MGRFFAFLILGLAGCSNAPLAGTLDTLFPSRVPLPTDAPIRADEERPRPIPERAPFSQPEPDYPGRRLPDPERLPELQPLGELPRGDRLQPPGW